MIAFGLGRAEDLAASPMEVVIVPAIALCCWFAVVVVVVVVVAVVTAETIGKDGLDVDVMVIEDCNSLDPPAITAWDEI